MFVRGNRRKKDGKVHEYWSIVENRRLHDGRVVQRQLLYLGEISASQHDAWRRSIEVEDGGARRQVALFAAEQLSADEVDTIGVRLSQLRLQRPRQWGACWLALQLWQQLELDSFWRGRLRPSREGTPWLKVLETLVCYRLIDPGSEWRLHRQWFDSSAMADVLESDFALAAKDTLYRCLDRLLVHKDDLFEFLVRRWGELFQARFDVLLYDLTSTYFETDELRGPDDLSQFGYSRDKRGDCRQVVIALVVTPEGFPLSYEVMSGNTVDSEGGHAHHPGRRARLARALRRPRAGDAGREQPQAGRNGGAAGALRAGVTGQSRRVEALKGRSGPVAAPPRGPRRPDPPATAPRSPARESARGTGPRPRSPSAPSARRTRRSRCA